MDVMVLLLLFVWSLNDWFVLFLFIYSFIFTINCNI